MSKGELLQRENRKLRTMMKKIKSKLMNTEIEEMTNWDDGSFKRMTDSMLEAAIILEQVSKFSDLQMQRNKEERQKFVAERYEINEERQKLDELKKTLYESAHKVKTVFIVEERLREAQKVIAEKDFEIFQLQKQRLRQLQEQHQEIQQNNLIQIQPFQQPESVYAAATNYSPQSKSHQYNFSCDTESQIETMRTSLHDFDDSKYRSNKTIVEELKDQIAKIKLKSNVETRKLNNKTPALKEYNVYKSYGL